MTIATQRVRAVKVGGLAVCLLLLLSSPARAQFEMPSCVVSAAGGVLRSPDGKTTLVCVVGQSAPAGKSGSSRFEQWVGFLKGALATRAAGGGLLIRFR